jgi:hypothetical protein
MPTALTEKRVLEIWQESLQGRPDLLTEENEPVRIVYPGRPNDDRGADLKDAVIATRQGLRKGDIEIHRKTSHWWEHGHHRDAAYNRVILHVVYQNDSEKGIVLQNGATAPTVALHNYVKTASCHRNLSAIPCRNAFYRENTGRTGEILDRAGEQRFLAKAAYFKKAIVQVGAGQALYKGLMTALGYSKNKASMAELADRLPLKKLEALVSNKVPDTAYLAGCQALLTGTAGLLPLQCGNLYPIKEYKEAWEAKLEKIWLNSTDKSQMRQSDWRSFKVRPGNHPVRRLAAMSHLLVRYRKKGLLAGLEEKVTEAGNNNGDRFLEGALLVPSDSYWCRYLDFGIPATGIVPALLGKERVAEIIVNVLLPFVFARGTAEQSEKATAIYHSYPAPAENALVKHMRRQLGISKPFIASARRQQGLIHIYKTLCSQGKCSECPLNSGSR